MPGHKEMVYHLLEETRQGHVFGPEVAFGPIDADREHQILWDSYVVYDTAFQPTVDAVARAFPDRTLEQCQREVQHSLTKTVVFGPALTAGEIGTSQGIGYLGHTAIAIMCMYVPDQQIDVGDEAMLRAVELATHSDEELQLPQQLDLIVDARGHMFDVMDESITGITHRDAAEIKHCFLDTVLGNEARFFRHSQEYLRRPDRGKDSRDQYMADHGRDIADLMSRNAGFQAVAGILHATYRKDPRYANLPLVRDIHDDPLMKQNIRIWNTVARIADERGDWWMDAGNDPEMGIFSINPFNVPHPALISRLCELAGIEDPGAVAKLQDLFAHFHDGNEGRIGNGIVITEAFFEQMRNTIRFMEPEFRKQYDRYVTLAMRVGEIAWVNMRGDILMSAIARAVPDY